jgi:FkbM family methyltransferase
MQRHLQNPRMIHRLNALDTLARHPLALVDVGMRAGLQGYWPVFGKNMRVIGFEPDEKEFQSLSAQRTPHQQIVLPYVLDSEPRKRDFYIRAHNRAADGFYVGLKWWSARLGLTVKEQLPERYRDYLPTPDAREGTTNTVPIETTTFNKVAREHDLGTVDFMKIDTEGAELDIIKGASDHLGPDGILGIEVEIRTLPTLNSPLFHEVYPYLYDLGYYLADVDLYRRSRAVLPLPVAADHRDHNDKPLAVGHTIGGQIAVGDALFMRDLLTDGFQPDKGNEAHLCRIIKHACLYELFAMPDCAAELLIYYREPLRDMIDVDELLTYLVPDYFAKPVLYKQYLEMYEKEAGRLGPSAHMKEDFRLRMKIKAKKLLSKAPGLEAWLKQVRRR